MHHRFLSVPSLLLPVLLASQAPAQTGKWSYVPIIGKPEITPREECSFAQAGGKFYLLGGRGLNPVQEYTPTARTLKDMSPPPSEINHFQALSLAGLVYVICAFHGTYPHEQPVTNMLIFDPLANNWIQGMAIPQARQRGSAGVAYADGKIYVALGIQDGHSSKWVPYLDSYDPATGAWKALPDAPRARDHFQTAIVGGKLYAVGGRRSNWMVNGKLDIFSELEKVDVYDIAAGTWSTLSAASNMPEPRSGTVDIALGNDIIVAGGGNDSALAHKETHAFNTATGAWRALANLNTGRQVLGGVLNNGGIYVASGSGGKGGTPTLNTMEVFFLGDSTAPAGEPLTAGQVAAPESPFNLGLGASGSKLSRVLEVKHSGGTQGVLIASAQISGTGFTLKTAPAYPVLAAPGGAPVPFEIEYASTGAAADGSLDLTLAVPKGVTVKIPLEANRKALALRAPARKGRAPARERGNARILFGSGKPGALRDGNGRATRNP